DDERARGLQEMIQTVQVADERLADSLRVERLKRPAQHRRPGDKQQGNEQSPAEPCGVPCRSPLRFRLHRRKPSARMTNSRNRWATDPDRRCDDGRPVQYIPQTLGGRARRASRCGGRNRQSYREGRKRSGTLASLRLDGREGRDYLRELKCPRWATG